MLAYIITTGLTAATFLITGLYVYANNPKKAVYQRCLIFSAAVAFWSFGYFITLLAIPNFALNLFSSRFSHAIGAFIPIAYLHFVWELLNEKKNKFLFVTGYLISGLMFLACFTPLVVKTLLPKMGLQYYPEWGWLYPIYASLFVIYAGYAEYRIAKRIKIVRGAEKSRLTLFFWALGFAFGGGVSLFLLIFNIPFPPFYSVLIILYPPMMAYAILAYRFLDIEVIIKKTLVFAGLLAFVFGVYSMVTMFVRTVLNNYFHVGDFWLTTASIFLVVLGYDPLRTLLINLTDRYLFQKPYDYHKVLKDASRGMSKIESLHHLMGLVLHFLTMKMRVENAAILSLVSAERHFRVLAARGYKANYPRIALDTEHPLIQMLIATRDVVQVEEVSRSIESESDAQKNPHLKLICDEMRLFGAQCAVPSFLGNDLKNILLIGGKKSGVAYSAEDLSLLMTLAQESSIAFENARLYDEVIDRTQLLENTNKNLTEANQKLKVTQASLVVAEKNATMVGMAKAIAHEVNNPLATVAARADWVSADGLSQCRKILTQFDAANPAATFSELEKKFLKIEDNTSRISKSAKRIEIVVKTLTDILKDTKGEISPLSLVILVREAREATRFVTYEENLAGCQIEEHVAGSLLIMGNLEQLLQVFINLIKNAYEAMGTQADRRIEIRADLDSGDPQMARIEIKDNGPGIPPEILKDIWKQGFSTKTKTSNEIGAVGQGQGLFICKHMIESIHGGVILAESVLGQGTTFIIKLPLAKEG